MRRTKTWLIPPLLAAAAALAPAPADAGAATYVARPADGGRIALRVDGGRLRSVKATLPSRCENNHGGSWGAPLGIDLTGAVVLRSGGFGFQGQAPSEVRYQLDGRLRGGAIAGRLRLTYLDLDFVGVDDSYLCDTGTVPYRAVKRR